MKIKYKDWIIDSKTLFHIEWKKYYPVFVIHEKYEKIVKRILRILTLIGIATSIITLPWYLSLSLSIALLAIEQLFEKVIFLYTTIILQNFPSDFKIEGERWISNGFSMPEIKDSKMLPFVGPAFNSKEYAVKFFNYIRSWNNIDKIDKDNKIILSFVIEPDNTYTTFIYANPSRDNLNETFDKTHEKIKYEKYGKRQQRFIIQITLAHNLQFKTGYQIDKFLKTYSQNEPFFLCPFFINNDGSCEWLHQHSILKYSYKIKQRKDLIKNDIEYNIRQKC